MQQEQDIALFLEAYAGSKAAKLAELEGMQLASRPSNRAGLDPAALAALEQQVRMLCCVSSALKALRVLVRDSTGGSQGPITACPKEQCSQLQGYLSLCLS